MLRFGCSEDVEDAKVGDAAELLHLMRNLARQLS
jgi:hypothetical protein